MYPKLLTWKAKKANVDENTAKFLWNVAETIQTYYGTPNDYESLNRRFDDLLIGTDCAKQALAGYTELIWGRYFTKMIFGS